MNLLTRCLLITLTLLFWSVQSKSVEPRIESADQPTVLITGANRGIGLALAAQFSEQGYRVIATARKPDKAEKLKALGVQIESLDISSQESVNNLAKRLKGQALDILINNAGIQGHSSRAFSELKIDQLAYAFNVNSLGALRVTQGLLPNLNLSNRKVVASISSRMGSTEENNRGCCYGYRASKAALNNFNKSLSVEFADQGFVFSVLHPGWVKTDMTSNAATYTPAQSARHLFAVITALSKENNGKFYDLFGKELPW